VNNYEVRKKLSVIRYQDKALKALELPTTANLFLSPTKKYIKSVKYCLNLSTSNSKIKSKAVKPSKYHENIPNINAEMLTDSQLINLSNEVGIDTIPLDVLADAIERIKHNYNEENQQGLLAMRLFQNLRWKMGPPAKMNAKKYEIKRDISIDVDQVKF
jgi:hypothetical protein